MLRVGYEEPLQANSNLFTLDEERDEFIPALFGMPTLNRYSFVWVGARAEAEVHFIRLIQAISDELNQTLHWVLSRKFHSTGDYRIRSLSWLHQRRKEGWLICHDNDWVIATKTIYSDILIDRFLSLRNTVGYPILFFGEMATPEELLRSPLRKTITTTISAGLTPSQQFLHWLEEQKLSMIYPYELEFQVWGAILITPRIIATDRLIDQGIVGSIFPGQDRRLWHPFLSE